MTISVLQEVQTSIGGTGQASLGQAITFSAGSTAIVMVGAPSGTTHAVTDNINGSTGWSNPVTITTVGGGAFAVYKRDNMAAGATTITDTYGASTAFTGIWVAEIGGTSGYNTATTINVQTTGATRTSSNGTPSQQPGLIFGFMYNDTQDGSVAGTADTGSGFTQGLQQWTFGSGRTFAVSENKRYTSITAIPATFIPTGATDTTGCVAIFLKETVAGPTATIAWTT